MFPRVWKGQMEEQCNSFVDVALGVEDSIEFEVSNFVANRIRSIFGLRFESSVFEVQGSGGDNEVNLNLDKTQPDHLSSLEKYWRECTEYSSTIKRPRTSRSAGPRTREEIQGRQILWRKSTFDDCEPASRRDGSLVVGSQSPGRRK